MTPTGHSRLEMQANLPPHSARDEGLEPRGLSDRLVPRDKFDADTNVVMTGDAPGQSTDEHQFADRRAHFRSDRNARERDIEHLAIHDIAVGAREADIAACRAAMVTAQRRFIEGAAALVEFEQFGEPFALVRGAVELNTEAVLFRASDAALEAAKPVDVNDDERAGRRNDVAKDTRSTRR